MQKHPVITSRAASALDDLSRWDDAKKMRLEELGAKNTARVMFDDDPLLNRNAVDPVAPIWSKAAEIAQQHRRYVGQRRRDAQLHADAIAAWNLVRRTRDRDELEKRLRVAIAASGKIYPRCAELLNPDEE